eukprot:2435761-Rhodomonas_salina.2
MAPALSSAPPTRRVPASSSSPLSSTRSASLAQQPGTPAQRVGRRLSVCPDSNSARKTGGICRTGRGHYQLPGRDELVNGLALDVDVDAQRDYQRLPMWAGSVRP